ncbi:MAG: competence/damage-inducible protein A [Dehalococcoidia bacterium]
MRAEIISVGTEIILGEITDTNAAFLAGQLPSLGINLYWVTQVGDNQARLIDILQRAWERSDLILVTGGLGPTEDDITRESISQMLGEEMETDPELEKWLRDLFARVGQEMPDCNIKQAKLIPSARPIPNPRGSAPGWWVTRGDKMIIAMPGPPAEMQRMWRKEVKENLRHKLGEAVIYSRVIKIFGLGEANVDEQLGSLLSSNNPTIGVYAKQTGIELRLTAKAGSEQEAAGMITPVEAKIRSMFGDKVWGTDDEVLEKVVGDLLRYRELTLATMESCTGGMLANILTNIPGSSDYFRGGLISYTNDVKIALGVDPRLLSRHGAVSAEVAESMAHAAMEKLNSDIGVGITGVAGPDELEGKPIGTIYTGFTYRDQKWSTYTIFPQHRVRIKRYAVMGALNELRRVLLETDFPA